MKLSSKKLLYSGAILQKPQFSIFDIQMSVDGEEFEKGLKLFNNRKVNGINSNFRGFSAVVEGTHIYNVSVDSREFDRGNCDCYLGQKDTLCKHIIALAIGVVSKYRPEDFKIIKQPLTQAMCSGEVRDITKEELVNIKIEIRQAFMFIKSYGGSSKKWFEYTYNLLKGARIIIYTLSKLPVCKTSAKYCIDLLIKIDEKMTHGIDDSDGSMGNLIEQIIDLLRMFINLKPELEIYIKNNFPQKTNFGWEIELFKI